MNRTLYSFAYIDCFGTPFENSNRTWFYFSIQRIGGEKNQTIKLNILNLNKQSKLFTQGKSTILTYLYRIKYLKIFLKGMNIVIKRGSNGKWERMKEKPTFYITDENFILTFFHRTFDKDIEDNLTFYAFTFPFTYTEQLELLSSYDKKHEKSEEELAIIIREINEPRRDKLVIKMNDNVNQNFGTKYTEIVDVTDETNYELPTSHSTETLMNQSNTSIDDNTSESMQQLLNLVNNVKIEKVVSQGSVVETHENVIAYIAQDVRSRLDEVRDDIYYHRELLINSCEQRR